MVHSDVEDDIWADSDNEEQAAYERNLAEKEWERLQEDHGNVSLYFYFFETVWSKLTIFEIDWLQGRHCWRKGSQYAERIW